MRGRSPERRNEITENRLQSNHDVSPESIEDENCEDGSYYDLNFDSYKLNVLRNLTLFVKCILFSLICTLIILCMLHPQDLLQVGQQITLLVGLRKTTMMSDFPTNTPSESPLIQKHSLRDLKTTTTQTLMKLGILKRHPKEPIRSTTKAQEAVVHTISIPDECRFDRKGCSIIRHLLSDTLKQSFQSDGVIALRGIFTKDEIHHIQQVSHNYLQQEQQNIPHKPGSAKQFFYTKTSMALRNPDFRYIALESILPKIVAELLWEYNDIPHRPSAEDVHHTSSVSGYSGSSIGDIIANKINDSLRSTNQSIRMIRDVFLVKDQDPFICGWHVDDIGFWPATYDSPGINAWIALDDMDPLTGGGFALSVGSHRAPWRYEAYNITGATYTLPSQGYLNVEDMFQQRNAGTCNIKTAAPELHNLLEDQKRIYHVQAGDVIFHTRWLFHRTVPFHHDFIKSQGFLQDSKQRIVYRRYSVRYAPSDARLPEGFGTELSKLYDTNNRGTLEDVSQRGDAWYPKCWPEVDPMEIENIISVLPSKIAIAEDRQKEVMKEMKPYLQEIGKRLNRGRTHRVMNQNQKISSHSKIEEAIDEL